MANRYLLPVLPAAGRTVLAGDVAHHLGRVLRARAGDTVQFGDGRGQVAAAAVVAVDRQTVTVDVGEPRREAALRPRVTLAFACPRPARADWLLEHGTEVGVAVFQPLWTTRSRPQALRLARWRKITAAALGQCQRAWLPEIAEPLELGAWLASEQLPPRRLLAEAHGERLAGADERDAVLLVGPEGGFADEERRAALAAGFVAVRLGAHTLRTETAALVGAALMLADADRLV